jgi:prepilin-type N-terminal cleavage/methylation domain-containing protein
MKKHFFLKSSFGFTLIEMIIVIGIMGIIATVGSGAFFSILKGSLKAKTMRIVKQNGDYALSVMERMIRNARVLVEPTSSSTTSSITIKNPDGGITTFSCENGTIASNGASLISSNVMVENCSDIFTVVIGKQGVTPSSVKINFNLKQSSENVRLEEKASINFQTSVGLRNY